MIAFDALSSWPIGGRVAKKTEAFEVKFVGGTPVEQLTKAESELMVRYRETAGDHVPVVTGGS